MRHYVAVISGAGERPPETDARDASGVAVTLAGVIVRSGAPATAGISLQIPAGQSVALHSHTDDTAVDVLDVVAGLRRPRSGQVVVGGLAVHRLGGAAMERFRADRGLLSARFPLLPSLSVTDNVLAASRARRADDQARERVTELLELTGSGHLVAAPVETLTAEQRWRILIARALLPAPRLVLAEDPAPTLPSPRTARVLDLLLVIHYRYGFTLLLATDRLATAARCRRLVTLAGGLVTADELSGDDDPWTRGRVDRIG
jgi:putative ABC transport system ATP-binding protein